jgi:hypothetical protein
MTIKELGVGDYIGFQYANEVTSCLYLVTKVGRTRVSYKDTWGCEAWCLFTDIRTIAKAENIIKL